MKKTQGVQAVVIAAVSISCTLGMLPAATQAAETEKSPWLVRARLLGVMPDDDSSAISVIGGNAEVDNAVTADLDFSYFLSDNIALELTLAVSPHDVNAVNTSAGNLDLGDVWLLPPTLTAQYHFIPDGRFRPYVGAGLNYTIFFNEDAGDVADDINYDNAIGYAIQAGIDIEIDDNWAVNLDVKKLWLNTDVSVQALGTVVQTSVDIDPWLFGLGIAYRF
jgi:outer membrane protein